MGGLCAEPRAAGAREMRAPELRLEGLVKRFGATTAVDGVSLRFQPGSIHALVGENGAGKSTLMRMLFGLVRPDAGRVLVDGREARIHGPAEALAHGIGMIHQHFMLVPAMTVLENIVLGRARWRGLRLLPRARLAQELERLSAAYGLALDPGARVADLGVGARQRVEIARLLVHGARCLICDEPTAVLAPPEVEGFFGVLRRFRDEGRTIVFITHKLGEVLAIADRVSVLRHGRVAGEMERGELDRERLVRSIMGEEGAARALPERPAGTIPLAAAPSLQRRRAENRGEGPALEARGLVLRDGDGRLLLDGIDLVLEPGRILGIAGVAGNGQSELAAVLSGRRKWQAGVLRLGGCFHQPGDLPEPWQRPALIPEDRNVEGLIGGFRLWENLLLGRTREAPFLRGGWFTHRAARDWARPQIEQYGVHPPDEALPADALSGGNQQKLLCAREMLRGRSLLIACQPTRGIDIRSTAFIHETLREFRAGGGSVLLVSADLDEILALADAVAVLYRGRLGPARAREQVDLDGIGRAMAGLGQAREEKGPA